VPRKPPGVRVISRVVTVPILTSIGHINTTQGGGFEMSVAGNDEGSDKVLEARVLDALAAYFESQQREVEESKKMAGPEFVEYEEARQQVAVAEKQLVEVRRAMTELQAGAVDAIVGGDEASELEREVSNLQQEVHELAEAEKAALRRKEEAEERLRRAEVHLGGELGEVADGIAASALSKIEEIDSFKERLDERFTAGRTSVLRVSYSVDDPQGIMGP
jgi:hypothetical protein